MSNSAPKQTQRSMCEIDRTVYNMCTIHDRIPQHSTHFLSSSTISVNIQYI